MNKLLARSSCALLFFWGANGALADSTYLEKDLQLIVSGQVKSWHGVSFYGNESGDTEFTDDTHQMMSGMSGRISLPLGSGLSMQMDADWEYSSSMLTGTQQDDLLQRAFMLGGHLSYRNPSTGLVGGFVSFGSGNQGQDRVNALVNPVSAAGIGAFGGETQIYFGNLTFYGQGGFINSRGNENFLRDAVFGRGVMRYFISPDTRLQIEGAYVVGDTDLATDDDEMTIIEWGARFDTALPALPIIGDTNIFLAYRGAHFEKNDPTEPQ